MVTNAQLEMTLAEHDRAVAGMRRPVIVTLPAGQVLFRFASTKNPTTGEAISSSEWSRGSWWFMEDDYRKIIDVFLAGKLNLGTVARGMAAVQPSFSMMDVSVKASLLKDTKVYIGLGSTQYRDELPNGWFMTLRGSPSVRQVYIPGMRTGSWSIVRVMRQKIIATGDFGY